MVSDRLSRAISRGTLLLDGAMGTELQRAGLKLGGCGEQWNLTRPDTVLAIHRASVAAGARCLTTNTFGGNRLRLTTHGAEGLLAEINRAAVNLARQAFDGESGWVLGDVGPLGEAIQKDGPVTFATAKTAFAEQIDALLEAGADAILVETQYAPEELAIALEAARSSGAPCVLASIAFDWNPSTSATETDGDPIATMGGMTPEQAVEICAEIPVDVIGANCGARMSVTRMKEVVRRLRAATPLPLLARPNAGPPQLVDGRAHYAMSPDQFAADAAQLVDAGASLLGGCCGTTPAHIEALGTKLGPPSNAADR